jgi:hypothetical protein
VLASTRTAVKVALGVVAVLALAGGVARTLRPAGVAPVHAPRAPRVLASKAPSPGAGAVFAQIELENRRCEAEWARVLAAPALPGAPKFEASRAQLVARAKGEPVFFARTPEYGATTDPEVIAHRLRLTTTAHSWDALATFLVQARGRHRLARDVLLREGYLYAEDPNLAFALASLVRLEDLFGDTVVWIQRGELTLHAERGLKGYVFTDGPNRGEPVRLILFDRIGTGTPPPELHRDLRALKYRMHFDAIRVERTTDDRLLTSIRYGGVAVPSVIESQGAHLELVCRVVAPVQSGALQAAIGLGRERQRVLALLRAAIVSEVDERLPFDEPKTEIGQEDGILRRTWEQAYLGGAKTFRYNGDRYHVFDRDGRPRVPQVCVDFLTDTFERASGTWWRPEGQTRGRIDGALDFDRVGEMPRRRVEAFIEFALRTPAWFDVHTTSPSERIELGYKREFFDYLTAHADTYQAGDIVVIRGLVPWDDEHMHYHSFFVYETDPVSGIPIAIAGNAGTPAVWTWEAEARRTPHRSVWYRIRPRLEWLSGSLQGDPSSDGPPVLARGGS